MKTKRSVCKFLFSILFGILFCNVSFAQEQTPSPAQLPQEIENKNLAGYEKWREEFGPVVSSYLSYLDTEQLVTDDRASQREISRAYYRRNTNRISALRQVILRIARETNNDYVPELEAVAIDELHTLFEEKPNVKKLQVDDILNNTFRYLGTVRVRDTFYIFERLSIYEQADLIKKQQEEKQKTEQKSGATTAATKEGEQPKKPKSP